MSRPRLTRRVKLHDKDITLQITVHDIFRVGGGTVIVPSNVLFTDLIDRDVVESFLAEQLQSRI